MIYNICRVIRIDLCCSYWVERGGEKIDYDDRRVLNFF